MQAGPDLDADVAHRVPDGAGAPDGPCGPVEGDEEAVPCGVNLAAAEPVQQATDAGVMLVEQVSPAAVTELAGFCVDATMSVNSTVARLRSESGVPCVPVRNSWTTSSKASASPT
jgi:hypothetical protein